MKNVIEQFEKKQIEKLTENKASDKLMQNNTKLKSKLEEYQHEKMEFKEKYENTEKSYQIFKECLLGSDFYSQSSSNYE